MEMVRESRVRRLQNSKSRNLLILSKYCIITIFMTHIHFDEHIVKHD